MKKIAVLVVSIFFTLQSFGQAFQLNLPLSLQSPFYPDQLLNFSVFIQDNQPHHFSLIIRVEYSPTSTPQEVCAMGCPDIELESMNLASLNSMANIILQNMSFSDASFQTYYYQNASFPSGNYNICYELHELTEVITLNDCIDQTIQNFNQIVLVNPFDETVVPTLNPLFSWLYTQGLTGLMQYQFTLVEVLPTQTPEMAIQSNTPLVQEYLCDNMLFYPVTALPLEECKYYAWKVNVVESSSILAESELWSFFTPCPEVDTIPVPDFFFPLSNDDKGGIYQVKTKFLPFYFDQPYEKIKKFKISILNTDGTILRSNSQLREMRRNVFNKCFNGLNLFVINLESIDLTDPGTYILKVNNQKRIYYLRFNIVEQ
jgi:hypothetical protein